MNYYRLKAQLKSPLLVQENRQSNTPVGLDYLPGSSLRGAVAGHFLRCGGSPDDEMFRNLFLTAPICFPDLFPINDPDQISRPIPVTACSCKRYPGFLNQDGHGVGDTLAALLAGEMEQQPITSPFFCNNCQQDMTPFDGFWNDDQQSPEKAEPVKIYHRHTGTDRQTGTAASAIFYVTQGISETLPYTDGNVVAQHLAGGVYLDEEQLDSLNDLFSETIFAGADRTRGMGELELTLEKWDDPDFDIESWDIGFRKKLSQLTSRSIPTGRYFTVGLDAHLIMVDRFLRPSAEMILDFPDIVPVLKLLQSHTVRGWQSSWGLPKPEDKSVKMGSVYLFQYQGNDVAGLKAYLKNLMVERIGLRRCEGFGQVRICDPLHIQEAI